MVALGDGGTLMNLSASGVVTLPPGYATPVSSLQISSIGGPLAIAADGSFTVPEPQGGPATVVVTDANGNLVLLGHVDATNPSFNEVDATSTAEELLYLATGSFLAPISLKTQIYPLLAAAPDTAIVAGVIAARMLVNPTAVGDDDSQIVDAVTAAATSLVTPAPGTSSDGGVSDGSAPDAAAMGDAGVSPMDAGTVDARPPAPRSAPLGALSPSPSARRSIGPGRAPGSVQVAASSPAPNQILDVTVSASDVYGLSVAKSSDQLGVTIQNTKRIHRHYFVFRNGFVPSTGMDTDKPTPLNPWVPITDGDLSAVDGVTGTIGALVDIWDGKFPWVPQTTPTLPLPFNPADALKNSYQVLVVGAGATSFSAQDLPFLSASQFTTVQQAAKDAAYLEIFKEVVWPIVTLVVPLQLAQVSFSPADSKTLVGNFGIILAKYIQTLDPMIAAGQYRSVFGATIKLLADNVQARGQIFNLIFNFLLKQSFSGQNYKVTGASVLKSVTGYLNVLDKLWSAGDTGMVIYQLSQTSRSLNTWDVSATPKKLPVVISPKSTSVAPAGQTPFQVTVGQGFMPTGSGTLSFDFEAQSGTLGPSTGTAPDCSTTMRTPCIKSNGHGYLSSTGDVLYTAPADAKDGASDTLTVTVEYLPTVGMPTTIGSDTATLTISSSPPCQPGYSPATVTVSYLGRTDTCSGDQRVAGVGCVGCGKNSGPNGYTTIYAVYANGDFLGSTPLAANNQLGSFDIRFQDFADGKQYVYCNSQHDSAAYGESESVSNDMASGSFSIPMCTGVDNLAPWSLFAFELTGTFSIP